VKYSNNYTSLQFARNADIVRILLDVIFVNKKKLINVQNSHDDKPLQRVATRNEIDNARKILKSKRANGEKPINTQKTAIRHCMKLQHRKKQRLWEFYSNE
jgi:hypothetical protein